MERSGVEQPPVELAIFVPFGALADFAAHEQQLLAGKQPLIREQCPEICKFLPVVTGHAAQQGRLAVNHLIVR